MLQIETNEKFNQCGGWLLAHETFSEEVESAKSRARRLLGSLAVGETVDISRVESDVNPTTLLAATQMAALGDIASRQSVEINVQTNIAELLYKAGHQTSVMLDLENGRLTQSGRELSQIQANTQRHTTLNSVMRQRADQELENVFCFEELIASGALDDHDAVVFSLCPRDKKTKKDYGFFEDTDTCSIQLLRTGPEDKVELQTALVAGKRSAQSERHDKVAIERIAQLHDLEIDLDNENNSLRYIVLVPKDSVPNGVVDIVEQYDTAAGGVFYGEEIAGKKSDYRDYARQCAATNESFAETVQRVTDQLLQEAHTFTSPAVAIKRLHKLAEQFLVRGAVSDDTIDARVFGGESAAYIDSARMYIASGEVDKAFDMQKKAIETAVSSSCPLFSGEDSTTKSNSLADLLSLSEDKYGSLKFTCKKGHTNTRPRNKLIEHCQQCGVSVRC